MKVKTGSAIVSENKDVGYAEYEINVEEILRRDLPKLMLELTPAPLTLQGIAEIPEAAKGAYMLFHNEIPVYAGKTDTKHGFRQRLERHYYTTSERIGIEPGSLKFVAIRIMVFSNFDAEAILIKEIRKKNPEFLSWNNSGFGSNDPGHRRETQKAAKWDKLRPIDIDKELTGWPPGKYNVRDLLLSLKNSLPYSFRYQTDTHAVEDSRQDNVSYTVGHKDQRAAEAVVAQNETVTVRSLLNCVLEALPEGWVATRLPNRVILYKEPTLYADALEVITK